MRKANTAYVQPRNQITGTLTTLKPAAYDLIQKMSAEGQDFATMADTLGIAVELFREFRRRDPQCQEAIDKGRAKLGDELTNLLLSQARNGNTTAAIFLAKARLGWRDVGAAPDGAQNNTQVNIYLNQPLSDDQFSKLMPPMPGATNVPD